MSSQFKLLAVAAFLLLAVRCTVGTIPSGVYTTTINKQDIPAGFPAEAVAMLTGEWNIEFTSAGRYVVSKDGQLAIEGRYTSTQDQLVLTDEKGPLVCDVPGEETGKYKWLASSSGVKLTATEDKCSGRSVVLTTRVWAKK